MDKDTDAGQLRSILDDIKHYWSAYGGSGCFIKSPYLWIAFFSSLLVMTCAKECWSWPSLAVSVLPNMLGFTLGGYAVMLGFGDKKFQNCIKGPEDTGQTSPYLFMSASLLHFILFQILSLLVSIFCQAIDVNIIVSFLGCWLFLYSIFLAIAASFSIFFFSRMYDLIPPDSDDQKQ